MDRYPGLLVKNLCFSINNKKILENINFSINYGEILAVIGGKASGKSTLVNILNHFPGYSGYHGEVMIDGKPVSMGDKKPVSHPVSTITKKHTLVPNLTVAENIFLERQFTSTLGSIDWHRLFNETAKLFENFDIDYLSPRERVENLNELGRYVVEILRELSRADNKVVIFEEVTDNVNFDEAKEIYRIMKCLRELNYCILYISYKAKEVRELADKITVLYKGKSAGKTVEARRITYDEIVNLMVGKLEDKMIRDEFTDRFNITGREKEIIHMIVEGYSNKEIGEKLFISLGTVKNHIYKIYQKTNVKNRIELSNLVNL